MQRKANQAACKRRRAKLRAAAAASKQGDTLLGALVRHEISGTRGKRPYTAALAEHIARVGCAPSAGGARAPLAGIISMTKDRELRSTYIK